MDATIAELITDAIKILGPAFLTFLVTYKVSKLKLRELENKHEFSARVQMFKYYKDRKEQLSQAFNKVSASLWEAFGYSKGSQAQDKDFITFITELIQRLYRTLPGEIENAIRDMEQRGLNDTPEYKELENILSRREFEISGSAEELCDNMLKYMEINSLLRRCHHLIFQNQFDSLFGKYI